MFDYTLDYSAINFREQPQRYRIGKGEQGVLLIEPYKSEILPHWRFRTPELARASSEKIYQLFLLYKEQQDFVGMDMARKFLQMGYTRARRYANHPSGKKYSMINLSRGSKEKKQVCPQAEDWETNEKAQAAKIFYEKYLQAKNDSEYLRLRQQHKKLCEQ